MSANHRRLHQLKSRGCLHCSTILLCEHCRVFKEGDNLKVPHASSCMKVFFRPQSSSTRSFRSHASTTRFMETVTASFPPTFSFWCTASVPRLVISHYQLLTVVDQLLLSLFASHRLMPSPTCSPICFLRHIREC